MTTLQEDLLNCAKSIPQEFYNTSFFITGATGLIGSLITKSILCANSNFNAGIKVYAFVRNQNKASEVFAESLNDSNLNFVYGDINSTVLCDAQIDYIIHTASQTASKEMVTHPVETAKTALMGTLNILDFAVSKKVKGICYLSSMEAFGSCNNETERLSEKDLGYIDLSSVRSCYSESKRMNELLCTCYANEYDLNVKNARLAQVFGAGISKNENRVFAQFVRSAMSNEDIVLHTDGTSWGNYCYTSDAIAAIFKILYKGEKGQTYTVVNEDSSIMIKDMAQVVISCVPDCNSKLVFDIPESNSFGYAPKTVMKLSSEKLQKLDWKATVSLKDSFTRLIKFLGE